MVRIPSDLAISPATDVLGAVARVFSSSTNAARDGPLSEQTDLSPFAQDLAKLQEELRSNPPRFKSLMTKLAEAFKQLAQQQPSSRALINDVANAFTSAARTGQLPVLPRSHDPPSGRALAYAKNESQSAWSAIEQKLTTVLRQAGV